jgi:hypothetical protein
MALQHADWLGLVLGVVRRGPGGALDPELVQADIDHLEDVDGEIEDPEGHLAVLNMALRHLTPRWQDLGVLDENQCVTERGAWGLPRALSPNLERRRLSRRVAKLLQQRTSQPPLRRQRFHGHGSR